MNPDREYKLHDVLKFSIPLALTGILQLLFNAADTIVAGKLAGSHALAAVGASAPIIHLLVGAFTGMAVGSNILVARCLGIQDYDRVKSAIHSSFVLSGILGIIVMAGGILSGRIILEAISTPQDILDDAAIYLTIYYFGVPAMVIYNYAAAILRAFRDTEHSFLYLCFSGAVNVIINLFLVIVFRLGVIGVAAATVISQYISLGLIVKYFLTAESDRRLELNCLKLNKSDTVEILKAGFPAGLQVIVINVANVMIQGAVNTFGTAVVAARTASGNLMGFCYTAMNSVYHSSVTFVSLAWGAHDYKRIRRIAALCITAVSIIGVPISIGLVVFSKPLLGIYVSPDDPAYEIIIQTGKIQIIYAGLPYVICGFMETLCGTVRGMGRNWLPLFVSAIGVSATRFIWMYTAFKLYPTLEVLFLSFPISWIITSAIHWLCIVVILRKVNDVAE